MIKKVIQICLYSIVFLFGLGLIFHQQIQNYFMVKMETEYNINHFSKEEIKKNEQRQDQNYDFANVESIGYGEILKSRLGKNSSDLPIIGGVAIPNIEINLPIFKGISEYSLLYGAGTLFEQEKMGEKNYILASHRASNPKLLFTPLERITLGDNIYITDLTNIYIYKTTSKKKVPPSDTSVLAEPENQKIITLITCGDMQATTRLIVQGTLVSKIKIDKKSESLQRIFDAPVRTF